MVGRVGCMGHMAYGVCREYKEYKEYREGIERWISSRTDKWCVGINVEVSKYLGEVYHDGIMDPWLVLVSVLVLWPIIGIGIGWDWLIGNCYY